MKSVTLTPAYGRDYKSRKALLIDWNADKDFVTNDYKLPSRYINKADALTLDITHIQFRYNGLKSTFVYPIR